jgi:hypothetical protein
MWHIWAEGTIVTKHKRNSSSHQKFITDKNFNAGIYFWQNETYWPRDFHKRFYDELAEINKEDQFSIKWWYRILPHLNCWRTTPKSSEMSVEEFTRRARDECKPERLKRAYQKINQELRADDIENDELTWEIVKEFTKEVTEIKGATTPTFCSKLCHFISPKRFPVTDKGAMGLPKSNYKGYWNYVKKEWKETTSKEKEDFRKLLKRAASDALPDDFPYACKIAEICLIGEHQLRKNQRR